MILYLNCAVIKTDSDILILLDNSADGFFVNIVDCVVVINSIIVISCVVFVLLLPLVNLILFPLYILPIRVEIRGQTLDASDSMVLVLLLNGAGSAK